MVVSPLAFQFFPGENGHCLCLTRVIPVRDTCVTGTTFTAPAALERTAWEDFRGKGMGGGAGRMVRKSAGANTTVLGFNNYYSEAITFSRAVPGLQGAQNRSFFACSATGH